MNWYFYASIYVLPLHLLLASGDPCNEALNITNGRRRPSQVNQYFETDLCDKDIDPDKWYHIGGKMTDRCVELNTCGTYAGIWFFGDHPTGDEIVDAKVCAMGPLNECCEWSENIRVKKCSESYVYKLAVPPNCPMSYCAGEGAETVICMPGQVMIKDTRECLDIPSIDKPRLSAPYISSSKTLWTGNYKFNPTAFSIDCLIDILMNKTLPYERKLKIETVFKMNADEVANFTNDFPIQKVSLNESFLRGHIGKSLTCSVRFYYVFENIITTSKSNWLVGVSDFIGFHYVDMDGQKVDELKIEQGKTTSINVRATFPITTGHCFDNKICDPREYVFAIESTTDGVNSRNCEIVFGESTGALSYTSSPLIEVSAIVTPGIETSKSLIKFKRYNHAIKNTLFENYQMTPITVTTDEKKTQPICRSVGDPHFSNFGGIYFDNYLTGDFNLLSTKHRIFQVQVRQIYCGGGRATCNCGIVIREGNNLVGISGCDYRSTALIFQLMSDNVNPKSYIEKRGDTSYILHFASGIKIKVDTYFYLKGTFLNIYVHGLKHEEYEGICSKSFNPANFEASRIPEQESFFTSRLPKCLDEVIDFPLCQCQKDSNTSQTENSLVRCDFESARKSSSVVRVENICDVMSAVIRRERLTDDSKVEVELISNYTAEESKGFTIEDIFFTVDHKRDHEKRESSSTNITTEIAGEECNRVFQSSPVYDNCIEFLKDDVKALKASCIEDVKLTEDKRFARVHLSVFERVCSKNIERQITIINGQKSSVNEALLTTLKNVETAICPYCLNEGQCTNGTCVCVMAYGGADCSVDKTKHPSISFVRGTSFCDLASQRCHLINLETINVDDQDLGFDKCNLSLIIKDRLSEEFQVKGSLLQPGFFQCSLNRDRFVDMTQKMSKVNILLNIVTRIKNLDTLRSNELNLTVFDGVCLSCSQEGCTQKPNTCHIDNVCYKANEILDVGRVCNPNYSTTNWSKTGSDTPKKFPWTILIICVVVALAGTMTLITVVVLKRRSKHRTAIINDSVVLR